MHKEVFLQFSDISSWLKLNTKHAFILLVVSSIFLFGSNELLNDLGLQEARETLKTWVGVIWLISIAIIVADIVAPASKWVVKKLKWRINLKKCQKRLHQLSEDEKAFLSYYLAHNTRTQPASVSNGMVNGLVSAMVVYRASNIADHYDVFPFNIQPWALEYLMEHPGCLE